MRLDLSGARVDIDRGRCHDAIVDEVRTAGIVAEVVVERPTSARATVVGQVDGPQQVSITGVECVYIIVQRRYQQDILGRIVDGEIGDIQRLGHRRLESVVSPRGRGPRRQRVRRELEKIGQPERGRVNAGRERLLVGVSARAIAAVLASQHAGVAGVANAARVSWLDSRRGACMVDRNSAVRLTVVHDGGGRRDCLAGGPRTHK